MLEEFVRRLVQDLIDHSITLLVECPKGQIFQIDDVFKEFHRQFMGKFPDELSCYVFNNMLLDFHPEARRQRNVVVVMRNNFPHESTTISPAPELREFQSTYSEIRNKELQKFFGPWGNGLITASAGKENEQLSKLLMDVKDSSGKNLNFHISPIRNLFPSNRNRKGEQVAFVYSKG